MNKHVGPTGDQIETLAAQNMGSLPAAAIAELAVAAEQMRDSEAMTRFRQHLEHMVEQLRPVAERMAMQAIEITERFYRATDPAVALMFHRAKHGGNGTDAQRHPDQWVSMTCSAFLCEVCPSDKFALGCNCPHHRKAP